MSEHRNFKRVLFDGKTQASQDEQQWQVELVDLSLNGVLFKQPTHWKIHPGQPLSVTITLADQKVISMTVVLTHITPSHAGCAIQHIDLDSITSLKRLIELNVGGDEILSRELHALVSMHEH